MKVSDVTIIHNSHSFKQVWRDLLCCRDLLYYMIKKELLIRYKQTFFGVSWCLIRPLIMMAIFTVIFGYVAKFPSGGVPYPLFVLASMLPWQLYSSALTDASNSVVANAHMISKVYFPRVLLPVTSIVVSVIDFLISFILFLLMMSCYHFHPDWRILWLPFLLIVTALFALGAGLWFSALNVKYRDFRYILPFFLQIGLFISPVGFGTSMIPEQWRFLYYLNPLAGIIDAYRWALLRGIETLCLPDILLSLGVNILILVTGLLYFHVNEIHFGDVV